MPASLTPASLDPTSLVLLLGALSLLPLILICTTSFLKISVVLMIVRNALGVQQVPPAMAVYAISLAATLFVMAPTLSGIEQSLGLQVPGSSSSTMPREEVKSPYAAVAEPLRAFMVRQTLPEQRQHFLGLLRRQWPQAQGAQAGETDFVVLVPAFVVSELQLAFQIGFILYVPFVVIDLLISNLLMALGMQMVSPMTISLPLKLLLFVAVDGWTKLIDGLVMSYA